MRTRKNWAWTPEDEAKLRDCANKGVHLRSIALKLRRSESSVKTHARALNLKVRPPPRSRMRFDA